jgi:hypothetical protein
MILLQAAIAHLRKSEDALKVAASASTLALTRALVAFLHFPAASAPAFIFTRREVKSCASGAASPIASVCR